MSRDLRLVRGLLLLFPVVLVAGMCQAAVQPTVAAAASCTTTVQAGTQLWPVLNEATPGKVICLEPGTYEATAWGSGGGGEQGKPVVLQSLNPKQPALIEGRFVTWGVASWIEMRDLKFKGTTTQADDDVVVLGTPHEQFVYNDVDGIGEHICMVGADWEGVRIEYSTIDHNTVHDCEGDPLHEQGIYLGGNPGNLISNNWVWHAAARCYQIRSGKATAAAPTKWLHNVCAESREGFIYGELTPEYNVVEKNVIATVTDNSAYTYGSVGTGNTFRQNCISKAFGNNGGVTVSENIVAAAIFVNAAAHDYTQTASSPCLGYGTEGRPGPGNEGPPIATTGSASGVGAASAVVAGTVNPESVETTYRFEYGTTQSYGTNLPVPNGSVGSGALPVEMTQALAGLSSGTTYHYRIVATSSAGTSNGVDHTFQTLPAGEITEYSVTAGSEPQWITAGPDGNLWFASTSTSKIGKMTIAGTVSAEYQTEGPPGSGPRSIATGENGYLWFAAGSNIGKLLSTTGAITEYSLPVGVTALNITKGPDGNMWFTGFNKIGKITSSGTVTAYSLPAGGSLAGITLGPDGNLWFSNEESGRIGKITTSGSITEYALPKGTRPRGITSGPDGNLWVAYWYPEKVAKVSTSGLITEYALPSGSGNSPSIVTGADGNLWMTRTTANKIDRVTTAGIVTEYALPAGEKPNVIASGPDNRLWFTKSGAKKIGAIVP